MVMTTQQSIPRPGPEETEVGIFPSDWQIEAIKNVASISTGAKNTQDRVADGAYPFFVRSQTVERINSYSFDGEAVLTAGDGVGTGKVFHYINGKFDYHQRVYKISDFVPQLDGYYFYLFFSSRFYDRIASMTAKSSVDSVRMEMIAEMPIPLPPITEQRAIAEAVRYTDRLITSLDQIISKKRDIKQATMQQLLTGKTRLPGFNGDWDAKRLGEIADIGMGRTPSRQNAAYWGRGYKWLSIADLKSRVVSETKEEITSLAAATMTVVPRGTLVMSFKLTIGKLAFAGEDMYSNEAICNFSRLRADAEFLYYVLGQTDFSLYGKQAVKGFTLNTESLNAVEIPYPSLPEQKAIARVLSEMDAEIAALEQQRNKTQELKQGMMQELLTGRRRLV